MAATVTSITPRRAPTTAHTPEPPQRPFRDNPRLILAGIAVLLVVLIALVAIANGTSRFSPDFLSEFVLYALSAADLTMLAGLAFVLARNVIKLIVERRKALPFARFRAKLVVLLLGMTLIPAAALIKAKDGHTAGVVVATDYLTGDMASRARSMTQSFEHYNQLRVLK